ncbi:hypothetical protein E4U55_000361 [Claviceps digitariae]|nr:hypothetical protein E4U55_000361 [Claviceps digitariae]
MNGLPITKQDPQPPQGSVGIEDGDSHNGKEMSLCTNIKFDRPPPLCGQDDISHYCSESCIQPMQCTLTNSAPALINPSLAPSSAERSVRFVCGIEPCQHHDSVIGKNCTLKIYKGIIVRSARFLRQPRFVPLKPRSHDQLIRNGSAHRLDYFDGLLEMFLSPVFGSLKRA